MKDTTFDLKQHPHSRYNPLTREWVLVSPHRNQRPWQGQVEKTVDEQPPQYDALCYLCPGNARAGGVKNPPYTSTFVFDNDFPALLSDTPAGSFKQDGLISAQSEQGICRVICFHPRHDLTIARMELASLRRVVDVWTEQYVELGSIGWINNVQIFENRGALMGASNPHPHCQVWSTASLPNETAREMSSFREHHTAHQQCLLCDYMRLEAAAGDRIVCENSDFTALVPFWAVWPFEVLLVSKRHLPGLDQLTSHERESLADVLMRITTRYDNLFEAPFPYSMGFHQRPTDGEEHPEWHFHAHFYPPLLRSTTVRKFMVGFEMLGSAQRDITPESAAERLRTAGEKHYLER